MRPRSSACRFVFRSVSRVVSPRFASRPAPRVVERGNVVLRAVSACFPCPCDVISSRRRGGCLPHDIGDAAMSDVDSGGVALPFLAMSPMCVGNVACAASLRACLAHPVSIAPRHPVALLPAPPPSRPFAPPPRVDGRGAIWCLPRLSLSSPSISVGYVYACSMSCEEDGDDGMR